MMRMAKVMAEHNQLSKTCADVRATNDAKNKHRIEKVDYEN